MITLTNGVQIPENAVQLQTTAAIDGYYVTQPLRLVQYDETLPVAAVQLTYQNQPYTPSTGAELNVRMGKPDGTTVYNPCLGMDSSGIVYFAFTLQMTIISGTGTLTVEIADSGVKNSAPIIAEIRPNPVPEGSIESADEFLTLQEILAEAEKWGQIVQANASNIQQVVDNLEDIQNAAENAQAAAASAAAAQQAAQEALGFRKFYGAVVPDASGNLDPSRPMTVGPAASMEIESKGDRIQSVTALGFTTQAGSGDPSPTNVRALTNGGLRMVKVVFDGTENWVPGPQRPGADPAFAIEKVPMPKSGTNESIAAKTQFCTDCPIKNSDGYSGECIWVYGAGSGSGIRARLFGVQSAEKLKEVLADRYAAGDPVTLWYVPADKSDATGLYVPIILTSGEYRATCLPLTAPLCEGDSVVSYIKSGCDKTLVLDGSQSMSMTGDGLLRITIADAATGYPLSNYVASITPYQNSEGIFSPGNGTIVIKHSKLSSVEAAQAYLPLHPLTVWYRSTNYTPAADIPVSLETHQQAVLVLDGTENWLQGSSGDSNVYYLSRVTKPGTVAQCSHFAYGVNQTGKFDTVYGQLRFRVQSLYDTVDTWKAYLAAQYAAGTPVTIVYQLATPITYAHEAVVLEAATGEQLTYTVTGQSGGTVSVALKPFQDGGRAAMADNATNAVTAQTAANSQQLGGLTLSALQNRLVPVGYIFSWAPVDDGPDLSTPAKVAAYFGFGTWQAYGTGQVLVCVDSGQTEFATVGKTGGEKTHTLTTAELAKHSHKMCWSNEGGTGTGNGVLVRDALSGGPWPYGYFTETDGGGQAHNNLQPYITVYRWQRIA